MAERTHLNWFRERLAASRAIEPKDPAPILAWREAHRSSIRFKSELIGLDQVRDWSRDEQGNVQHRSGQFFRIEGARVESSGVREVATWDQPIMTQLDGGVLAMVARETDQGVEFLLQAIAECGNIDTLQLGPTVQSTWSNIRRAHTGRRPPMLEVVFAEAGVRTVYRANHNEEGGRFWKKSNENVVVFLDDEGVIETDMKMFYWASLSQIKELALTDNVLNPFVKTILMPL
ncbi:NDP-hexose 2,3-dehydratase family protein [Bradyrhizobium sp.]|uniref:NDP-hexose 2,3-dehydratase family protein n=1 Tax=Bradyrhizobium sp. TaxID=376 RepID=UPI002730EFD4|nr:NDP-hexose 2,3-dehydratase family protein [Bradyrhizobium sp.]MDP1866481.1 NDP-hexose 2,3-dehydratase family protein [Bradyrhizobium sp.]MDP3074840.1 NDP-hexose 2,3-dehydratase family protein [Bradyrhizobium sp.]